MRALVLSGQPVTFSVRRAVGHAGGSGLTARVIILSAARAARPSAVPRAVGHHHTPAHGSRALPRRSGRPTTARRVHYVLHSAEFHGR